MQPGRKRTFEKVTLLVAIVGVLIAGAAYVNDLLSGHSKPEAPTSLTQTTSGSGSPAIAGVGGSVTINGGTK